MIYAPVVVDWFNEVVIFLFQDAGVRGRKREERPPHPRPRQEKQSVGGKGEVRHHVRGEEGEAAKAENLNFTMRDNTAVKIL